VKYQTRYQENNFK